MNKKLIFWALLPAVFVVLAIGAIFLYGHLVYPLKFTQEIEDASKEFNVPAHLIASVINVESGFDKNAISNKGAVGLMQIMPTTAEWVAKKLVNENATSKMKQNNNFLLQLYNASNKTGELFDAKTNIRLGTYYLNYLINKFKNVDVAICAYNAGEGKVAKWLENRDYSHTGNTLDKVPYKETENYLKKVQLNLKIYEKKLKIK